MPDLGDLTDFIFETSEDDSTSESSLADLDWLYPENAEYAQQQVLPEQNLDMVSDLANLWGPVTNEASFKLNPTNQLPTAPNTPFWSERAAEGPTDEMRVSHVETFLRGHLQSGTEVKTALALLPRKFDKQTLRMASNSIHGIVKESGLIGEVYVDSKLFPKCASGEGQVQVRRQNLAAPFVISKEACGGCKWAQEGKCSQFDKRLVGDIAQIEYTQPLWEAYKARAEALGKDMSHVKDMASFRDRVKAANLAPFKTRTSLDSKPLLPNAMDKVTSEEAMVELKSAEVIREVIESSRHEDLRQNVLLRMTHESHDQSLLGQVKSSENLQHLLAHRYLLGSLYYDPTIFKSEKDRNLYASTHPHVLAIEGSCQEDVQVNLGREDVISQMVHRCMVQHNGQEFAQAAAMKLAKKLSKLTPKDLHTFAQKVYSSPVPEKVRRYASISPVIYDPTQGILQNDAYKRLQSVQVVREILEDPRVRLEKKAFSMKLLLGQRSTSLRQKIASKGYNDILAHWNLQGKAYFLTDGFTTKEVQELRSKSSRLHALPLVSSKNLNTYMKTASFQEDITERYVGLETSGGRSVTASVAAKIASSLQGDSLLEFANAVYAYKVKNEPTVYDAGTQKLSENLDVVQGGQGFQQDLEIREKYEITAQDIAQFKERSTRENVSERVARDLEYYAGLPQGKKLVGLMVSRFSPETVASVYFPSYKASQSVSSNHTASMLSANIYAELTSPEFKPSNQPSVLMPEFFLTKIGRWLRDEIASGVTGAALSKKIKMSLEPDQVVKNGHIILALRQEEGLFGKAYLMADAYGNCNIGTKGNKASVTQVLAGTKCTDCVYNREASCLLYARPLVNELEYDQDTFEASVNMRLTKGELSAKDASILRELDMSAKELTRTAHTHVPREEVRIADAPFTAHYGDVIHQGGQEKKLIEMLQQAHVLTKEGSTKVELLSTLVDNFGQALVKKGSLHIQQVFERTSFDVNKHVKASHIAAPTGLEHMVDYGLSPGQISESLLNVSIPDKKDEESLDINFLGYVPK